MKDLAKARKHLMKIDRELGRAIKKIKLKKRARRRDSPYVRLASAIISQQISTAAARSIWGKFENLFENKKIDFEKLVKFSDEKLRSAGVSPQKIGYLRDLAYRVNNSEVPSAERLKKMSDEEILESLIVIKGVGRWTIQMLLIFHYWRPDVWPALDLGVKKGYMKVHGGRKLPEEKKLEKLGARFKPYRSYAALYYWSALDTL